MIYRDGGGECGGGGFEGWRDLGYLELEGLKNGMDWKGKRGKGMRF